MKSIEIVIPIVSRDELQNINLGHEPNRSIRECVTCGNCIDILLTNIPNYPDGLYLEFKSQCTCKSDRGE